jgi:hypothetical protein
MGQLVVLVAEADVLEEPDSSRDPVLSRWWRNAELERVAAAAPAGHKLVAKPMPLHVTNKDD